MTTATRVFMTSTERISVLGDRHFFAELEYSNGELSTIVVARTPGGTMFRVRADELPNLVDLLIAAQNWEPNT